LLDLARIAKDEGLNIISANVFKENGETFLPATNIVEVEGVKVGFFGISPTTTPIQTSPLNVVGLEFRDYVESASLAVESLKEDGAAVIVALAHITRSGVDAVAHALGDDIDLIVKGHDHFRGAFEVNNVLIVGAGDYMTHIGKVSITIGADGTITDKVATVTPRADTLNIAVDPIVNSLAEDMKAILLEEFGVVVARSEVFLSSDRGDANNPGVRNSEQPLGNLIADAMRIIGESDFAIQNGGGFRADIEVGEITKLNMNAILPFGNVLVIKEVTPSSLKAIMEQGLRDGVAAVGWFPQISGMNILFDPANPVGEKILSITVNGTKLDLTDDVTTFRLAANNFLAAGGDGYTVFRDLPTLAELYSLDDVLIRYITENLNGVITADNAKIEGRLVVAVYCDVCNELDSECVCPTDAEFLRERAASILRNGLTQAQLTLSANNRATLTLVIDGREFVLAANVNNRNVSGQITLPDGSGTLIFDIKGNGSNIKLFRIV
jgi:2',3'-cyclic-nucleotide 2'-phosphodiesterase (5'-nucleotidase family)